MKRLFISAGKIESFSFTKSIGIGLIEASLGLGELLRQEKYDELIYVASCGLYDKNKPLLELFTSELFTNLEYSSLIANFYSPLKLELKLKNNSSLKALNINSSNYICADSKAALLFLKAGWELENMESFAVAMTAKAYKIKASFVFCASNHCDEFAHEHFLKNHSEVKKRLSSFIESNYKL